MGVRINRFLSQCGLGSRRAVESLVGEGRVRVNGEPIDDLGRRIDPLRDLVEVDGRVLRTKNAPRLLLLHKPRGVTSSTRAQGGQTCLSDLLPAEFKSGRLFHVGRLDRDSSGLLLLSSDGELAHALLHPRHPIWKGYQVSLNAEPKLEDLDAWRTGSIALDGRPCLPARVRRMGGAGGRRILMELREGRNRQIRRMVAARGLSVVHLHRVSFGPLRLGRLRPGEFRHASGEEWQALRTAVVDARSRRT